MPPRNFINLSKMLHLEMLRDENHVLHATSIFGFLKFAEPALTGLESFHDERPSSESAKLLTDFESIVRALRGIGPEDHNDAKKVIADIRRDLDGVIKRAEALRP